MIKDKPLAREITADNEGTLYLGEKVAEDLSREFVKLLDKLLSDPKFSLFLQKTYNLKASLFGSIKNQVGVRYDQNENLKIEDIDIQLFDIDSNEPMSDEVLSRIKGDEKLKEIFRLFMRSLQGADSEVGRFLSENNITIKTYDLEIFGQVSRDSAHGMVVFFEDLS